MKYAKVFFSSLVVIAWLFTSVSSVFAIGGYPYTIIYKTTDTSTASDSSVNNDPDLQLNNLSNGTTYELEANIYISASSAGDFKYNFACNNVGGQFTYIAVYNTSSSAYTQNLMTGSSSNGGFCQDSGTDPTMISSAGIAGHITIKAIYTPSSGTNHFRFVWSQASSNSSPAVVLKGSNFKYRVISASNSISWSDIGSTPTTLAGYGITNALDNTLSITINSDTQNLVDSPVFTVEGGGGGGGACELPSDMYDHFVLWGGIWLFILTAFGMMFYFKKRI